MLADIKIGKIRPQIWWLFKRVINLKMQTFANLILPFFGLDYYAHGWNMPRYSKVIFIEYSISKTYGDTTKILKKLWKLRTVFPENNCGGISKCWLWISKKVRGVKISFKGAKTFFTWYSIKRFDLFSMKIWLDSK